MGAGCDTCVTRMTKMALYAAGTAVAAPEVRSGGRDTGKAKQKGGASCRCTVM